MKNKIQIEKSATVSPCGLYRYSLIRRWQPGPLATFCLLNPSVADGQKDDNTVRKCMAFARHWQKSGIQIINVFAYRATDPKELLTATDPIGPENFLMLLRVAQQCSADHNGILVGWGANLNNARLANLAGPMIEVMRAYTRGALYSLGVTKDGQPKHPLYLAKKTACKPFEIGVRP